MTTISTVAGLLPTAYGVAGYDYIISDMMLAISWGLIVGTVVVLFLIPILFSLTTTMEKT
jgi:multidrug efflux pump subunit AcrB